MEFTPIGYFLGDATYKYDTPRQGRLFHGHPGRIELLSGKNFEMALRNLDGFERIWVIFQFHENENWRPTTRPPLSAPNLNRVGTFASRSPYRPNPIGLSCVKLLRIEGLSLFIDEADLLDNTPILDIKPYIPMADAFPDAKAGWVDSQEPHKWQFQISSVFKEKTSWILENLKWDLESFAQLQLSLDPKDSSRKRLYFNNDKGVLAYRTFRIHFTLNEKEHIIFLNDVFSGYSEEELLLPEDKYSDKIYHKLFKNLWG